MKKTKISLLALAIAAISSPVFAATATGDLQVNATVSSGCTISTTNIDFGNSLQGNIAVVETNITARCSNSISFSIGTDVGVNQGTQTRKMLNEEFPQYENLLPYTMETYDYTGTRVILEPEQFVSFISTGEERIIPLYTTITDFQYMKPGKYSDTLSVLIIY